jgi:arabinan endo-1,5-alpha-L-arabinosidase
MSRALPRLLTLFVAAALLPVSAVAASQAPPPGTYHNPLAPVIPAGGTSAGTVDSCADPTVVRGRGEDSKSWFMYCTTDPLNDRDTAGAGDHPTFHPVPTMRSTDLTHWTYDGDALPQKPSWADPEAFLWAPDVVYSRTFDRYYLSFVVTDTADSVSGEPGCHSDSAIGVATSSSPTGPWKISDTPLVAPRRGEGPGCNFFWTYDPDVLGNSVDTASVLYFGSYYGGVHAQHVALTPDGMTTTGAARQITIGQKTKPAVDPATERMPTQMSFDRNTAAESARTRVAIGNRYEGANVVRHDDWYYLFVSATNCCNGPLTGYSVFAGRSRDPLGPFVDREGNSLMAGRVGGTPVISMNGNRWVGTGHSSAFRDFGGKWWLAYHAVDRTDPYFAGQPGFTKRPALLDPVDWVGGWPMVRSGRWASDQKISAPAAQPGQRTRYRPNPVQPLAVGPRLDAYSDEFRGTALKSRWTWVREPSAASYAVSDGRFRFDTQSGDLFVDSNTASVLTERAPDGDFMVQTVVLLDVPPKGCCHNFVQAGLVVYGSDDSFVKLAHASIWETRQTEWATEVPTAPESSPRYGNSVVGPPADQTWLRIVKRGDRYRAYTSQDGEHWVRGGVWNNHVGDQPRIGLVSMGGEGFTARFAHVRVHRLGS